MFTPDGLQELVDSNHTLKVLPVVLAEWNMNIPDNIERLGNYRYRPLDRADPYHLIPLTYDKTDAGNYYTGATDADVTVDGGMDENNTPSMFTSVKEKMNMLYSLEDCIKPHRPRSGINKPLYLGFSGSDVPSGQYLNNFGQWVAHRPRYYVSSRYDQFKYWTSYRTEKGVERGVAQIERNGLHFIDDASPFVVYKEKVPANALVVKMQTNIGSTDLGPYRVGSIMMDDPLFSQQNATTPQRWRIEVLRGDSWDTIIDFGDFDFRPDGSPIVPHHGHVEVRYGMHLPQYWEERIRFKGETTSRDTLPPSGNEYGDAYFIQNHEGDIGFFSIWEGNDWWDEVPEYKWSLVGEGIERGTPTVYDLTNPLWYTANGETRFREFEFIRGIRIVVDTMQKTNCTFDLIEMSPRLVANITDRSETYSVNKTLADLGNSSVPVGDLLASTGNITLSNNDGAFSQYNVYSADNPAGSIIAVHANMGVKFTFWDHVVDLTDAENEYLVPVKTLYSEGLPQSSGTVGNISLSLRDDFGYLESQPAPSLFLQDISLSYAVITLLDYIGFSNFIFKRLEDQTDPIIPYFFVAPDQNVAEVLRHLAVATQSAMFFDEYNNFVVMSKEYMMPTGTERATDGELRGHEIEDRLANIINLSSDEKRVYNAGAINYTTRYIQRSYGSLRQAQFIDKFKTWIYKPVLLWEVAPTESLRTINELAAAQSAYALAASPLSGSISDNPPTVVNNNLVDNIIDLGENVYWITRPQGYLYANGEIIRYDSMEYSVQGIGNVWISDNAEYQRYFANLPFNGKMYPTGNLRIYAEPHYEYYGGELHMKNGDVAQHGRGQFGTPIVKHLAGIDGYWTDNANVDGMKMEADYLFDPSDVLHYPLNMVQNVPAGSDGGKSKFSSRNSIIKNFMADTHWTEDDTRYFKTAQTGTIQSSALVFQGPNFESDEDPKDYISYVTRHFDQPFRHFGTRLRVIGQMKAKSNQEQFPAGATEYYVVDTIGPDKTVSIAGGSAGLGIMVDKKTNSGYFAEICALTDVDYKVPTQKEKPVQYKVVSTNIVNKVAIVKTETNHSFIVGDRVVMQGFANQALNNEWEVTSVSAGELRFVCGLPDENAGPGVAEKRLALLSHVNNIIFWKTMVKDGQLIPVKLWSGLAEILVDEGKFYGQQRFANTDKTTVYDLEIEYKDFGTSRTFYIYLNGKQVATVRDDAPLNNYNTACLFIRGKAKAMFENFFALSENYSENTISVVADQIADVFGDSEIDSTEAFRKYAMSGFIQASYLSGISTLEPPKYKMFFEEFGTIMREAAHITAKYDQAYPALSAQISPTFNRVKGYVTSGFYAGSYEADFLVFNCSDKTINLDATTGNYLRIQGVTFTQNTTKTLTVDDYYKKVSNLADPPLQDDVMLYNPLHRKEEFDKIKVSRIKYGYKEFGGLDSIYIQDDSTAENILEWVTRKTMTPRKLIGVNVFGMPGLQLGDILSLHYKAEDDLDFDIVAPDGTRFVTYSIAYNRTPQGTTTTAYLVEV